MGTLPYVIVVLALGLVVAYWTSWFGRSAASRLVLWIGVLAPIVYSEPQTRGSLLTSGLSSLEIARGLAPFACLVLARMLNRPLKRPLGPAECLLAAYLALAVVSSLWSIAPKQTALKALVLIFSTLCIWGLLRRYTSPAEAVRGLATFVHVILVAVAAEALGVYHRAFAGGRLQGVFPQIAPDVLATLAVIGVLAVIFTVGPDAFRPLPLRLVLGAVYAAELIASETRSAIIFGVLIVLLSLLPRARFSSARLAFLFFGLALALTALLVIAPALQQRLHRGEANVTFSTLNGRTTSWAEGLQAWSTSRVDGLGYYSGHRFGPVLQPGQGEPTNLDNTWIESLVDLGIVGTALLGGFVLAANHRILHSRGAVPSSLFIFVVSTSLMYFATSFVNPTIAGNESINFVVWSFVLLLFPLRSVVDRESGEATAIKSHVLPSPAYGSWGN
jgi:O-antigen ligase